MCDPTVVLHLLFLKIRTNKNLLLYICLPSVLDLTSVEITILRMEEFVRADGYVFIVFIL